MIGRLAREQSSLAFDVSKIYLETSMEGDDRMHRIVKDKRVVFGKVFFDLDCGHSQMKLVRYPDNPKMLWCDGCAHISAGKAMGRTS